MKVSDLDAIKELMDTVLTASHVEALAPRLSLRVRNSEERDVCHFWAPLCMHVEYACCACGLPATALCSRCKRTRYCGALCQSAHWRGAHKAVCKEDASARKR